LVSDRVVLVDPSISVETATIGIAPFNYSYGGAMSYARDASGNGVILARVAMARYSHSIIGYDADTRAKRWTTLIGELDAIWLVANLDGDPQDEIVTSSGYIFDADSGTNQWLPRFSGQPKLLSLSALSRSLAVTYSQSSREVTLTDVELKTETTVALPGTGYIYNIVTGDIDGDSSGEIGVVLGSEIRFYDYDPTTKLLTFASTEPVNNARGAALIENIPVVGQNTLVKMDTDNFYSWTLSVDTNWRAQKIVGCDSTPNVISIATDAPLSEIAFGNCANKISHFNFDIASTALSLLPSSNIYREAALYGLIDNDSAPDVIFTDYYNLYLYDANLATAPLPLPTALFPAVLVVTDINGDGSLEVFASFDTLVNVLDLAAANVVLQIPAMSAGLSSYARRFEALYISQNADTIWLLVRTGVDVRVFEISADTATPVFQKTFAYIRSGLLLDIDQDNIPEVSIQHRDGLTILDLDETQRASNELASGTEIIGVVPSDLAPAGQLLAYTGQDTKRLTGIDVRSGKTVWLGPLVPSATAALYLPTTDGYRLVVTTSGGAIIGK